MSATAELEKSLATTDDLIDNLRAQRNEHRTAEQMRRVSRFPATFADHAFGGDHHYTPAEEDALDRLIADSLSAGPADDGHELRDLSAYLCENDSNVTA